MIARLLVTAESAKKQLTSRDLVNVPVCSASSLIFFNRIADSSVAVYDLPKKSTVTLARISSTEINILGSDGDHELGGKDWDDCIARFLLPPELSHLSDPTRHRPTSSASQ